MKPRKTGPPEPFVPFLAPITEVKPGEARLALLLTLNFFILFTAYYVLKPIREGLILSLGGGAELKSYAGGIQALAFIVIIPVYSAVANRFSGRGILVGVYLFMASNLVLLLALGLAEFHYLGVIFYVWMGVFNVLTISQTWSLCNELHTPEQGNRLFALIALGATSGGAFGSLVLRSLIPVIGIYWPMAVAVFLLLLEALLIWRGVPPWASRPIRDEVSGTSGGSIWGSLFGGLTLVFRNRYITLLAAMILVTNFINTNSEYMLGKLVAEHCKGIIAKGLGDHASLGACIGSFYAGFFLWVNGVVLLVQAFLVSRIVKKAGVGPALFFMPILALFSYSLIIFLPLLAIVRIVKIAENATDYSLNNTVREILFLPLRTEEKYKAKLAADTVFRRVGDALSAPAVFVIVEMLGLGTVAFAGFNIALVVLWLLLIWRIANRHRRLTGP